MAEAEKNMVFAARLTQQGHKIASMDDLMELYEKSFSVQTVAAMGALPHPTIQKFAVITVAIVGASRRFLAPLVRIGVVTDLMASIDDPLIEIGVHLHILSQNKEGRFGIVLVK